MKGVITSSTIEMKEPHQFKAALHGGMARAICGWWGRGAAELGQGGIPTPTRSAFPPPKGRLCLISAAEGGRQCCRRWPPKAAADQARGKVTNSRTVPLHAGRKAHAVEMSRSLPTKNVFAAFFWLGRGALEMELSHTCRVFRRTA